MSDTSHSSVGVADFRLVLGWTLLAYDLLLVSADVRTLTKMENAFNFINVLVKLQYQFQ